MTIQFLKPCMVNQNKLRYCCEICGEIPDGAKMTWFDKDEIVEDCDNWDRRVDLTVLKFGVDYIIKEYPWRLFKIWYYFCMRTYYFQSVINSTVGLNLQATSELHAKEIMYSIGLDRDDWILFHVSTY